ncbi:hypothetical protein BDV12DRAFT_199945 [Aspergillus spectabilis]
MLEPLLDDVLEDISQENYNDEQEAWTHLAAELPDHRPTSLEDPDLPGQRDADRAYDWDSHVGKLDDISTTGSEWWQIMKAEFPATPLSLLDYDPQPPLLVNFDGQAGMGKTHVIMLISAALQKMAEEYVKSNPIIRAAPTEVAANNVNGRTLHALFRPPMSSQ